MLLSSEEEGWGDSNTHEINLYLFASDSLDNGWAFHSRSQS